MIFQQNVSLESEIKTITWKKKIFYFFLMSLTDNIVKVQYFIFS